jgi:hypothetical protein
MPIEGIEVQVKLTQTPGLRCYALEEKRLFLAIIKTDKERHHFSIK